MSIQAQWRQIGQDIEGEMALDQSGMAISLNSDGSIVAIGTPNNNGNGTHSGQVRVYQNIAGTWTQVGQDIDGETAYDYSGASVSLNSDGSVVAIGAPYNSNSNGAYSGHVRVYQNIAGTWVQIGQDIDGETQSDGSGYSLSLNSDGSIVAIGAHRNSTNGDEAGQVRIFQNVSGTWVQIGQDINGEVAHDWLGYSVSLNSDGSIVAISAPGNDGNTYNEGQVQVYQNISGTWTQVGQDIYGETTYDASGSSVSLSSDGSIVAIGTRGHNSFTGQVRVFQNISGTWTQTGQTLEGERHYDQFGSSVSLSSDGSIVAIGAPGNSGAGNPSGQVKVFQNISGTWTQLGADLEGESLGDRFGWAVSINSDGSLLAIGAPWNDGNNGYISESGQVRVFRIIITDQPVSQSNICPGSNVSFSVSGMYLTSYQWQVNEGNGFVNISNGGIYSGATTGTLNITGVSLGMNNYQYRCIVTNSHGTDTSDAATLTIDNEAPIPDNATLPDITATCEVSTLTPPTATDNCTGTITGTHNLTLPVQTTTVVTWTFDDGNGNTSTQTQNIIITDDTPPTITCPNNQTINLNQGETYYTVSGVEFDPVATDDNCTVSNVINNFNNTNSLNGAQIPIGTTTIEWTVTDEAGNQNTCNFDVTVIENAGFSELEQAGFSIYPNPSSGIFSIINAKDYDISITDTTGKVVYHTVGTANEQVHLPQSGIYIINFRSETTKFSYKIIVK